MYIASLPIVFLASAKIDDLGQLCSTNSGYAERSRSSILPTGFSGRSVSWGRASSSTTLAGKIGPDVVGPDCALFSHFHLLAQLVANALQPFAHRSVVHAGVRRESRRAPAAVIPPIAEPPFFRRQRRAARCASRMPLRLGPARLRLVEDRNIRDVVETAAA